jgi:hypothetical protein
MPRTHEVRLLLGGHIAVDQLFLLPAFDLRDLKGEPHLGQIRLEELGGGSLGFVAGDEQVLERIAFRESAREISSFARARSVWGR